MPPLVISPRRKLSAVILGLTAVALFASVQLAGAALPKFKPGAPPKADTTKAKPAPPPATSTTGTTATPAAPAPTSAAPAPTGAGGAGVGAPAAGGAAAAGAAAVPNAAPVAPAAAKSIPLSAAERAALRAEIDRALKSMADSLKLTPTQRAQARPILLDHAYQVKQLRERYSTQERTQPVVESMQRDLQVMRDTTDAKMARVLHSDQMTGYMMNRDQWLARLRARMGVTAPKIAAAAPPAIAPPATPPVVSPMAAPAHPAGNPIPSNPAGTTIPSQPAGTSAPVDTTHHR